MLRGAMYGVDFAQYWTRRPMGPPLKNHSKFSKTALWPQNFLRLRRAKRGFAFGTVPHSPELATLTVTIIPVTPDSSSKPRGAPRVGLDAVEGRAAEFIWVGGRRGGA